MSASAQELAEQFQQVTGEFITFVEGLSDAELARVCPNEKRTIAALARHVAHGILFEMRYIQGIADGQPLPVVEKARLDRANAERGEHDEHADRDETLMILRRDGETAAGFVAGLTDEQLQRVGAYVDWVPPMSVDGWIEHVLIGHISGHLASMRAVVESRPTASAD